jgi:hypothetical protein
MAFRWNEDPPPEKGELSLSSCSVAELTFSPELGRQVTMTVASYKEMPKTVLKSAELLENLSWTAASNNNGRHGNQTIDEKGPATRHSKPKILLKGTESK